MSSHVATTAHFEVCRSNVHHKKGRGASGLRYMVNGLIVIPTRPQIYDTTIAKEVGALQARVLTESAVSRL